MGWTYSHLPPNKTAKEFLIAEFSDLTVHKMVVNKGVAYMAVSSKKEPDRVWALVVLTDRRRNDYMNFGYKEMDETMGPNERNCPESVLKLLTPLEIGKHPYAHQWRKDCWEKIENKKKVKALKDGDVFYVKEPIVFTNGMTAMQFTVISKKKNYFKIFGTNVLVQLNKLDMKDITIGG